MKSLRNNQVQNLIYALIQVFHNYGAASIVGLAIYGLVATRGGPRPGLGLVLAMAWAIQGISGASFGLATYYFHHQLPDIYGVAIAALLIKIACVVLGFLIAASYVIWSKRLSLAAGHFIWIGLTALGVIALNAAAFLRWFS